MTTIDYGLPVVVVQRAVDRLQAETLAENQAAVLVDSHLAFVMDLEDTGHYILELQAAEVRKENTRLVGPACSGTFY